MTWTVIKYLGNELCCRLDSNICQVCDMNPEVVNIHFIFKVYNILDRIRKQISDITFL
jgi:hypothetical protein